MFKRQLEEKGGCRGRWADGRKVRHSSSIEMELSHLLRVGGGMIEIRYEGVEKV